MLGLKVQDLQDGSGPPARFWVRFVVFGCRAFKAGCEAASVELRMKRKSVVVCCKQQPWWMEAGAGGLIDRDSLRLCFLFFVSSYLTACRGF